MEYNDVVDKRGKINSDVFINSTIFKFFLSDGKILDHSICYGLDIIVMKIVNQINFNLTLVELIENQTGKNIFEEFLVEIN